MAGGGSGCFVFLQFACIICCDLFVLLRAHHQQQSLTQRHFPPPHASRRTFDYVWFMLGGGRQHRRCPIGHPKRDLCARALRRAINGAVATAGDGRHFCRAVARACLRRRDAGRDVGGADQRHFASHARRRAHDFAFWYIRSRRPISLILILRRGVLCARERAHALRDIAVPCVFQAVVAEDHARFRAVD